MKKKHYKSLMRISIFCFFGFFVASEPQMTVAYLLLGFLFLYLYFKLEKKDNKISKTSVSQENLQQNQEKTTQIPQQPVVSNVDTVAETAPKSTHSSAQRISKSESHHIAGTSYRQKEIESLGVENSDYDYTKKEMEEYCLEDERIYQYNFYPSKIELIEEPENQHDPNAIKVLIDKTHVGYIKSGSCSHVKKLIRENKIKSIDAEIKGGTYKVLFSEYDDEKGKDVYQLERGKTNYYVTITLYLSK